MGCATNHRSEIRQHRWTTMSLGAELTKSAHPTYCGAYRVEAPIVPVKSERNCMEVLYRLRGWIEPPCGPYARLSVLQPSDRNVCTRTQALTSSRGRITCRWNVGVPWAIATWRAASESACGVFTTSMESTATMVSSKRKLLAPVPVPMPVASRRLDASVGRWYTKLLCVALMCRLTFKPLAAAVLQFHSDCCKSSLAGQRRRRERRRASGSNELLVSVRKCARAFRTGAVRKLGGSCCRFSSLQAEEWNHEQSRFTTETETTSQRSQAAHRNRHTPTCASQLPLRARCTFPVRTNRYSRCCSLPRHLPW